MIVIRLLVFLFLAFISFESIAEAKTCLKAHVSAVTAQGRLLTIDNLEIKIDPLLLDTSYEEKKIDMGTGNICIPYNDEKLQGGEEVKLVLGGGNWSNLRILSPYQGIIRIPKANTPYSKLAIIVSNSRLESTLMRLLPEKDNKLNDEKVSYPASCHSDNFIQIAALENKTSVELITNMLQPEYTSCVQPIPLNGKVVHRILVKEREGWDLRPACHQIKKLTDVNFACKVKSYKCCQQ